MFNLFSKQVSSAAGMAKRSGFTGGPLVGVGLSLAFILAAVVVPVAEPVELLCTLVGVAVLCFFLRSYHRRESYALDKNQPQLLLNESTLVALTQLQIEGQRDASFTSLPKPTQFDEIRKYLSTIPIEHPALSTVDIPPLGGPPPEKDSGAREDDQA